MKDIASVPLNGLVALHLLSRDMLAMTQGVSIKTRDTGDEYIASSVLPSKLTEYLEKLREDSPQLLAIVCRLVARSVYLATDLPLAILEVLGPHEAPKAAPKLCSLVKEMDILEELEAACEGKGDEAQEFLEQPVPMDLEYWNDWNEGNVMDALKHYRTSWSQIREPYLAPAKPLLPAAAADPAVAGGLVKGLATSGWRQSKPGAGRRKAKRIMAVEDGEM